MDVYVRFLGTPFVPLLHVLQQASELSVAEPTSRSLMLGATNFYRRRPSLDPKRRPSLSSSRSSSRSTSRSTSLEPATLGGVGSGLGSGLGSGRRRPSLRDPATRGAASPPSAASPAASEPGGPDATERYPYQARPCSLGVYP